MMLKIVVTVGFVVLLGRLLARRVDWVSIEEHNRRYYNDEGDHVYYDRKLIRRKKRLAEKDQNK
ncbi:hypothetical protein [uncultured Alistipes sp.]|uniref:hypothetical protein n=1 Tax=uncultured Alistipes sp. TaxID=538949 RepID=UPI00261F1E1F|nr:hypothetical protein [uncultured Alistipes sp.]